MSVIMKIGVIGCGTISKAHFEAIKTIDNAMLIGVADNNLSQAKSIAEHYGCKVYSSNFDLISDSEINTVVLLTPPGYHAELIELCALNKKHVLAEKPIGVSLKDIDNYINLCKKNDVLLSIVSQHRFDSATTFARKKIKEGKLGKLVGANCSVNWYRDANYYKSWRGSKELAGGGVLAIQAIHTIDLMLWLMGEVESVKAYIDQILHSSTDIEDTAMACLKFKNGGLGVISATTSAYPGYPARLDILGTQGSLTIEGDEITFYKSNIEKDESIIKKSSAKTVSDPSQVSVQSIKAQYEDFFEALNHGKELTITSEEARKAFKLLDAIYKSSESDKQVQQLLQR